MRQTSYLGILLKVTVLILLLIQIDNITLYWALGPWGQEEEEALGLPLFISYILFFYIILYCPAIVLLLCYIVLYYPAIVPLLYYIVLALSQHCVILSYYCPSIVLYYPIIVLALSQHYIILSCYYLTIVLYYPIIVLYCPAIVSVLLYTFCHLLRLQLWVFVSQDPGSNSQQ